MERIEDLQYKNLKIIQDNDLYTFTSDSVILANFVKIKKRENAVEIGAGSGVVSILVSQKTNVEKISAFEIQKEMSFLAEKNICLNNLQSKIEIINDDIENFKTYLKNGETDVVFSNPPFMNNSKSNENKIKNIARHDFLLSPSKLCYCASKILKSKGRFYLVYLAERLDEIIYNLLQNNLQPKTLFFTQNNSGKIRLCVIEAVKDGQKGIKILPNLIVNDKDGKYMEELHTKYM